VPVVAGPRIAVHDRLTLANHEVFKRFAAGLQILIRQSTLGSCHERKQLPPLDHNDA
jgi:hypothetical protein